MDTTPTTEQDTAPDERDTTVIDTGGSTAATDTGDDTPVRGVDFGPYDIKETSDNFVGDLRAEMADENRDRLPVWTRSLIFYVPDGSTVTENVLESAGFAINVTAEIPGTDDYIPFAVTVSVIRSTDGTDLWSDVDVRTVHNQLEGGGKRVMRSTPWGHSTGVENLSSEDNDVYVIGADGPGWSVRAYAVGENLGSVERALVRDLVENSVVVTDEGAKHHYPMMVDIVDSEYDSRAVTAPATESDPDTTGGDTDFSDETAETREYPAV